MRMINTIHKLIVRYALRAEQQMQVSGIILSDQIKKRGNYGKD